MSAAMAARRRKTMIWMAGAAAVAALLGAASFLPRAEEQKRVEVGGKVLPDFSANAEKVGLVMVTTSDETYHLVHNADGWVLSEKGSYPVGAERIAELTRALAAIKYARPMTRDDKKFDRIGLGDPLEGGTGALLEVGDGSGTSFAKMIVGYRNGTSYVRQIDDLQAWAVDGATLPPLQRGARWLDLDVVSAPADTIAEVFIRPAQGPGYRLLPADVSGQQFVLAAPYANRRVLASFAPTMAAQALTRFAPIDVAPANTVAMGTPLAEYVVRTRSGLAIIIHSWRANDRGWVTIGAAASETAPAEAVAQAQAINSRAAGWAFALTELDWGGFSTPLAALIE